MLRHLTSEILIYPSKTLLPHIKPPYALPEHEAQRLFHGRGGAWPGLEHIVVDWLPPIILVTLYAEISGEDQQRISERLLTDNPACETLLFQQRYLRGGPIVVQQGEMPEMHVVEEAGLKYQMSLGRNRNTGLFLDIRHGREWLRERAHGKRVLNLFAYTCGFSVGAIDGGAAAVMNVDMSSPALTVGRKNHQLNAQNTAKVRFDKLDIFRSFGRLKRAGPFDLLVCDPPTLQDGSVDIERDYCKIIRRLDQFMARECELLMCLNAPLLGEGFLIDAMRSDAPDFEFVERLPLPGAFVETKNGGLKALHFRRRC